MMDINEKLFLAVKRAQTANILTYLSQGAAVNTRNTDLESTLITAARLRNFVVMKLLLANGANPAMKDCRGLTALHLVASTGDVECIKLLLAHNAPLDSVDMVGFTPLHYAIDRGHLSALDILLFCGANAYLKTQISKSPLKMSIGRGPFEKMVVGAVPVLNGIQNKDVIVQRKEFCSNQTYYFPLLELTARTPRAITDDSISFLVRRVRPEYASNSLLPQKRNLLISDSFEFRIAHSIRDVEVELDIPLYNAPDPYFEIVMKTEQCTTMEDKEALSDVRRVPGKNLWVCCTKIILGKFQAFILMTRPKTERVKTGQTSTNFRSEIDDYVQVVIPPGSFTSSGTLTSEIIPKPAYKEDDQLLRKLLTVGNIYGISVTNAEPPQNQVAITMPSPEDTVEKGNLIVMCSSLPQDHFLADEGYEEEIEDEEMAKEKSEARLASWEILAQSLDGDTGKLKIQASHFSIYIPMNVKDDTDGTTMVEMADSLTEKAIRMEKFVKFFALLKPLDHKRFSVVVECTEGKRTQARLEHWQSKDYRKQELEGTSDFCSVSGTEYVIGLVDRSQRDEDVAQFMANVKMVTGAKCLPLQFHQNRENFQIFEVLLLDDSGLTNCYINISKKRKNADQETLVELSLNLAGVPKEEKIEEFKDSGFNGFTNDSLLWEIAKKLGDEWLKVAIKLGLSFKTTNKLLPSTKETNLTNQKFKMLQKWRNMSRYRTDDLGVPDLLLTFRGAQREDIATFINDRLDQWYADSEDKEDRFCFWIESTRSVHTPAKTQGIPNPLSDSFFMSLVEMVGEPLKELGRELGLSPPEIDSIFSTNLVKDQQLQLLWMLSMACDKMKTKKMKFFNRLKQVLVKHEHQDAGEWVDSQTKKWLQEETERQSDVKSKRKSGENIFFLQLLEAYDLHGSSEA